MDEKLKSCPFCGGGAEWREYDERHPWDPFGLVAAHSDNCFLHLHRGPEEARSRWNTRSPSDRNDVIEECAKVADSFLRKDSLGEYYRGNDIAAAIRARKDQEHG